MYLAGSEYGRSQETRKGPMRWDEEAWRDSCGLAVNTGHGVGDNGEEAEWGRTWRKAEGAGKGHI